MDASLSLIQAIYAFSTAGGLVLAYIVWNHREKTGALPLLGSIVGGLWWSASLFLATVSSSFTISMWFERILYVGVVVVVASIFLFALEYSGRDHLVTRRTIALLSIQPVLVVVLALTNPGNVFFSSISPDPTAATGVAIEWGTAFWLHAGYSYILSIATYVLIILMLFRTRSLYRGQIVLVLVAVLLSSVGNLVWIAGLVTFDSTPVGFVATNALLTLAITRYRLIELTPIAYDRVIDTITAAMFVIDGDGRLVEVNPAGRALAEEVAGDDRLIGRHVEELLESVPQARDLYHEVVAEDIGRHIEFSVGGRHYDVSATPISDAQDRTHGWLFLVSDVTHQTRRERELRRRNEQLDQFAKVVSHDLRNPMTVAEGYTEMTQDTGDLDYLDDVTEALERMDAIISDVLALARDEKDAVELTTVDVRSVATDAWENVVTTDERLSVEETATIRADRGRLCRLFENLFRNAIEHGIPADAERDGGERPMLHVDVGLIESDDGLANGFYVADDGQGIPETERGLVLEMGYSSGGGTGFGLNIVKQLADVHEWDVRITESDAGGARIEILGVELADERVQASRST